MNYFKELNGTIAPPDEKAADQAQRRWDSVAKPLSSLGLLEDDIVKISALTGDPTCPLEKRAVLVFCADNGVVAQKVTQTGSEVTAAVACNMAAGGGCVCRMAGVAHAEVYPVDIGMLEEQNVEGLLCRNVARGTQDITLGPAMTREQVKEAIAVGIDLVGELKAKGYRIIATGEMGIGNTTTSSAVVSVLLGCDPALVTGRGAGLDSDGLRRKVEVIRRAVEINAPDPDDALDVLAKVGGLDIAGLAGAFLGGAIHRVPILVDGFISSAAALVADRLCPASRAAMLASHVSAEPAGRMVLDELGLAPLICAGMRLGEGTGAVAALPLLDMALAIYHTMNSFDDLGIEEYQPLG